MAPAARQSIVPKPGLPLGSQMIVAFDSDIWSWQGGGGISRYFVGLGRSLESLGHRVDVRAPIHVNGWLREWKVGQGIYLGNILGQTRYGIAFRKLLCGLNRRLEGVTAQRPDVMHHTAWHADRNPETPTVVTVHDCIWGSHPVAYYAFQAARIRKVALEADVVICPTEKTRRDATKYIGLPEEKIFVAPHGVTPLGRPRSESSLVAKQIAFVGPRSPSYKNFMALLVALTHLKDVKLCCLGGEKPSERERELLANLGLTGRIRFQQVRDDADIREGYSTSAALVIPALEEGFGLPMLEAFSLGVPVIASRAEALVEVSAGAATHVDATCPEALAAAIDQVLEDRKLSAHLAQEGIKRAADFSWERSAKVHETAYRAAIGICSSARKST
jgi:glycosyltransferase involved in cell wall biosynthesis